MFDRVVPPEEVDAVEIEIEVAPAPSLDGLTEFEDGSIGFEEQESVEPVAFNANLALTLPEDVLSEIGRNLITDIDMDKMSRKDWEEAYEKGLSLIGMKSEEMSEPWPGACGLFHTMAAEAIVRFQSTAIMEIFPPSGPCKASIVGRITDEIEKQAERVVDEVNYQLVEKMDSYRPETEKLLFGLAASGSAFRKLYPDPITGRPSARYVPAEKFYVPYGAASLKEAPRYTEKFSITTNELRKRQVNGFYRDVPVEPSYYTKDSLQEKKDDIDRASPPPIAEGDIDLYECHVDLFIPGCDPDDKDEIATPHIVTLDEQGKILSIYRNWEEGDQYKEKILWYVDYSYVPGLGFYGYGLLHLIGASTKAATIILRQLIDAGIISNLPAGYKAKGLRVKGDSAPLRPGEMREADVSGMKLSESFFMLPFKEPSTVLMALLQNVVEEGRKLGSIADVEIGNISSESPVGTAMMIQDRAMKVMSAVQARLHNSMRLEFRILVRLIRDSTKEEYDYEVDGPREIRRSDFDDRVDIIPVSDPNAATLPQRVTQYQAAVQMSATAPQIYDLPLLHRKMLEVLGIRDADKIIPDKKRIPPVDQVTENQMLIAMQPVKVYEFQPHEQHMQILEAFLKDPATAAALGQNPQANAIFAAAQAHYAEHYGFKYRQDIAKQLGVPLPAYGEPMPPEVEQYFSQAAAEAAKRVAALNQQEAAQKEALAKAQDPMVQMQQMELQIKQAELQLKQAELQRKVQESQVKVQAELQKTTGQQQVELQRIQSQERIANEGMIDKNEQFLADLKLEYQKQAMEQRESIARIAEMMARVEEMSRRMNAPQA